MPNKKPSQRPGKDRDLVPKDYEYLLGELKERLGPSLATGGQMM